MNPNNDHWAVYVDADGMVEIERNGSWFSEADDVDEAINILHGQRVVTYELSEDGFITEHTL